MASTLFTAHSDFADYAGDMDNHGILGPEVVHPLPSA